MSTFGIDLGTTYSCIATLDHNGNPSVIRNQLEDRDTLASAVFFESPDNIVVGGAAKDMVETDGNRVVQFVKREIGKADARTYEYFGKTYNAVEISCLILRRLKAIAEEQGEQVDKVVITCPAYFGLEERNATKTAGLAAGMEVLDLINEPTAAALAYCAGQFQEDRTIMVYDLGGGTFDVTIVNMTVVADENGNQAQKVRVLASGGNDRLGGKDWDDILYDHMVNACCDENGLLPEDLDAETRQEIRSKVEDTKMRLTNNQSAKVRISVNGSKTNISVSRAEFESMTAHLVAQTMTYVESVLGSVTVTPDLVLLVGGSTYMPMIRQAVENRFPGQVQVHEPNRAVAMGAAICANMLVIDEPIEPIPAPKPPVDESEDNTTVVTPEPGPTPVEQEPPRERQKPKIILVDAATRSFGPGVVIDGEYVIDNLIKLGDEMPALAVKTYGTMADNQPLIELRVFENVSREDVVTPCVDGLGCAQPCDPADNVKLLGMLEMQLPPYTRKNSPIEVTFQLEASGIYVKAVNLSDGQMVETSIHFENEVEVDVRHISSLGVFGE